MSMLVLGPFLIALIPGLVLLILGKARQPTTAQRKQLRIGGMICGVAFTYFGLAMFIGTELSARPEITGVVRNLRQFDGRHNRSSTFSVEYAGGTASDLTCGYNGDALSENEKVFVRYLQFDHSVLYAKVLSGPHAGWSLTVPADAWLGLLLMPIAGASFYLALIYGRKASPQSTSSV